MVLRSFFSCTAADGYSHFETHYSASKLSVDHGKTWKEHAMTSKGRIKPAQSFHHCISCLDIDLAYSNSITFCGYILSCVRLTYVSMAGLFLAEPTVVQGKRGLIAFFTNRHADWVFTSVSTDKVCPETVLNSLWCLQFHSEVAEESDIDWTCRHRLSAVQPHALWN